LIYWREFIIIIYHKEEGFFVAIESVYFVRVIPAKNLFCALHFEENRMRRTGFTLIELLVVIAIIALLLSILMPALHLVKEQGQRATCLSNLRQLMIAWIMYADSNDDKLVNGDTGEYPNIHKNETPWVLTDWRTGMTESEKQEAIHDGALWSYCNSMKIYKCPTVNKAIRTTGTVEKVFRTYAVVDSMNCKDWSTMGVDMIKKRLEIPEPTYRIVFLDDGGTSPAALGGWTVYVQEEKWWDPPPVRHGDGTTFSFADGHSEYHKWEDSRTIKFGTLIPPRAQSEEQSGNVDIRWAAIAAWGKAGRRSD